MNIFEYIFNYIVQVLYIIEGYALWAFDEVTGRATKRSIPRLEICNQCEYNKKGICKKCGCILKAKTRVNFFLDENGISIGGCPEKKW